jgi:hypothetical protein
MSEQSRNLGDILPWWDRLFRTYLAQPAAGQDGIVIGLKGIQLDRSLSPAFMLMSPFRPLTEESPVTDLPIAEEV